MNKPYGFLLFLLNVRMFFNRLIYGRPRLCVEHGLRSKARCQILDSFNCEECTPEEIEQSKREQKIFEELIREPILLNERDAAFFIEMLNNPPEPNEKLKAAFKKYRKQFQKRK